jgi:class 3 adenylate cyclase
MTDAMPAPQAEQEKGDRPEPRTVDEALRRMNRDRLYMNEVIGAFRGLGGPLEYDQGDAITVAYDDLYDLQEAYQAVVAVADRQERTIRQALLLHGPEHPAYRELLEALPDA